MHLQPRAVQYQVRDYFRVAADPQGSHEAAGGMAHERQFLILAARIGPDDGHSLANFSVVVCQVCHVAARRLGAQAAAVVVHVQRIELISAARPEARKVNVEEIVAPAVQEQHRPTYWLLCARLLSGSPKCVGFAAAGAKSNQRRGPPNAVGSRCFERAGFEARTEDVRLPVHGFMVAGQPAMTGPVWSGPPKAEN